MQPTKPFWQSKTLWFNVLTVIVTIILDITKTVTFTPAIATALTSIVGVVNVILRLITTTAIGSDPNAK